jgi:hypothetical protein
MPRPKEGYFSTQALVRLNRNCPHSSERKREKRKVAVSAGEDRGEKERGEWGKERGDKGGGDEWRERKRGMEMRGRSK